MYTPQEIDKAFALLERDIIRTSTKGTGAEDVLLYLYENPQIIWHMSWELSGKMTSEGVRLSHRADARASELATHDEHLVERRKIKRFVAYRLRTENVHLIKARLGVKKNPPAGRQQFAAEAPKCLHGLPKFVTCPQCAQ